MEHPFIEGPSMWGEHLSGCGCQLCDFDPVWESKMAKAREIDEFYRIIGWDAQKQADVFFANVGLEKLSKPELAIWLIQRLEVISKMSVPSSSVSSPGGDGDRNG